MQFPNLPEPEQIVAMTSFVPGDPPSAGTMKVTSSPIGNELGVSAGKGEKKGWGPRSKKFKGPIRQIKLNALSPRLAYDGAKPVTQCPAESMKVVVSAPK